MPQQLTVLGLMSGTSLDGLDICCVRFSNTADAYQYSIITAQSVPYSAEWKNKLRKAYSLGVNDLHEIDIEFGRHIAETVNNFIEENQLENTIDLIASHGQTIFHQAEKGITIQIGNGEEIRNLTGINVINDFRVKDVALGGQGAPLVPIGDLHLFNNYDACLNLGGIANISFERNKKRIAFDICPANLPLNKITDEAFGLPYDENGKLASSGKLNEKLCAQLDELDFYSMKPPKSLGYEWMDSNFYPLIQKFETLESKDVLASIVEHETAQIAQVLNGNDITACLITGGGAFNEYFIERLKSKTTCKLEIPDSIIVEFKEALIFAFLGYLNLNNQINTLASVTGAKSDSIGGIRHFAPDN